MKDLALVINEESGPKLIENLPVPIMLKSEELKEILCFKSLS